MSAIIFIGDITFRISSDCALQCGCLNAKSIVEALHQKNTKNPWGEIVYSRLLHDVSKRVLLNHALKGAMILKNMGYPRVASCIENHMDIPPSLAENISEESILYLADKIVDQAYCHFQSEHPV